MFSSVLKGLISLIKNKNDSSHFKLTTWNFNSRNRFLYRMRDSMEIREKMILKKILSLISHSFSRKVVAWFRSSSSQTMSYHLWRMEEESSAKLENYMLASQPWWWSKNKDNYEVSFFYLSSTPMLSVKSGFISSIKNSKERMQPVAKSHWTGVIAILILAGETSMNEKSKKS